MNPFKEKIQNIRIKNYLTQYKYKYTHTKTKIQVYKL